MIILGGCSIDPTQVSEVFTNGFLINVTMMDGNVIEVTFPSTMNYSDTIKTAEAIYLAVSLTRGEPVSTCINLNW
jgi:hypothetical protein